MGKRMSRTEYFMNMAELAAKRGTCPRLQAGCVLVGDNKVVATGYTSSVRGTPHCEDVGCLLLKEGDGEHCIRCPHAEEAAVTNMENRRFDRMVAYIWGAPPCYKCYRLLAAIGVDSIIFHGDYIHRSAAYSALYKEINIPLCKWAGSNRLERLNIV